MSEPEVYIPLSEYLSEALWPVDFFSPVGGNFLDNIAFDSGDILGDDEGLNIQASLRVMTEIVFDLPAGFAFVVGSGPIKASFISDSEGFFLRLDVEVLKLRLPRSFFVPALEQDGKWQPDPDLTHFVELSIPAGLLIDQDLNVDLEWPGDAAGSLNLPPCMIGESGIVVSAEEIILRLSGNQMLPDKNGSADLDDEWRGLFLGQATIHLPEGLGTAVPSDLKFEKCFIGTGGFSGEISVDWSPVFSGKLFGIAWELKHFGMTFVQNTITASEILGTITLPFFDEPVDVEIGMDLSGGFFIKLSSETGLFKLTKDNIIEIELESLAFEIEGNLLTARISGQMKPLLAGLDWPTFEVKELTLDSNGHVRVEGGWIDLSEQKPLSFYGFQIEITKIGFGKQEDGGKWVGFSGGLKLVDGLTAGASVEGLRLIWYDGEPQRPPTITLNGVGVEFEVPDVVKFKGAISYRTLEVIDDAGNTEIVRRFDGDITLQLISIGLRVEAALVVGNAKDQDNNSYNFFAIYVGVELPTGIPLGNTSLALYGFAGLFALEMEPNKRKEEAWYGVGPSDSWYKRDKIGVTDLRNKWVNRRGSLGLGAGVTIGTLSDNGFIFAGRKILVIVFPGPILMIEGKANLLKERATLNDEPLFRSLAVWDNRAGTLVFGLDVKYRNQKEGELIDVGGGTELFFNFHDPNAWHLYLGQKEPRERRIGADIFRLFRAEAYLMLDARQLEFGGWIGFKKDWKFGPAKVALEASLEGGAVVSFKPEHFYGYLILRGEISVTVFGFGATLLAEAEANADVFDPYHIKVDLQVSLKLPWPLPSFRREWSHEWGPTPVPPPLPVALKEIAVEHLKLTTSWPLPVADEQGRHGLLLPNFDRGDGFLNEEVTPAPANDGPPSLLDVPVVPLDARPHISFGRAVNDDALAGVNVQPGDSIWEWIGDPAQGQGPVRVRYGLKEIRLQKYLPGSSGTSPWQDVAWAPNAPAAQKLYGSWAPTPTANGGGVDQTKLWLWSKNAFDYTRHSGRAWDEWVTARLPGYPCIPAAPERKVCCDLTNIDPVQPLASPWQCPEHPEITLSWSEGGEPTVTYMEEANGRLARGICFPPTISTSEGTRPNVVMIGLAEPARRIEIVPPGTDGHLLRRCIDFKNDQVGFGPNPRVEHRVSFFDPNQSDTHIEENIRDGRRGLGRFTELEITLPYPCLSIEVGLSSQSNEVKVAVFHSDGSLIGEDRMTDVIYQRLTLTGQEIAKVVISEAQGESFVHEFCFESAHAITGTGFDASGQEIPSTFASDGRIEIVGGNVTSVRMTGEESICLARVCVTLAPDPVEVERRGEMTSHLLEEVARFSQVDDLFQPDTVYRLAVVTTIKTEEFPHDPSFNKERTQTQYTYFRTEGPPGLAYFSLPIGQTGQSAYSAKDTKITVQQGSSIVTGKESDWRADLAGTYLAVSGDTVTYRIESVLGPDKLQLRDNYIGASQADIEYTINRFESGAEDLTRYVRQTVPPTVPQPGQPPLLPRPVYRAYDIGVEFNENYVDLMYRMARRDLGLYLYDSNNRPVRDAQGRLIVINNQWGQVENLTLDASEVRWITAINSGDCTKLDPNGTPRDRKLTAFAPGQVLDADTLYEARLTPLLLHESFSEDLTGWQLVDQGTTNTPSDWQIRKDLSGTAVIVEGDTVTLETSEISLVDRLTDLLFLESDTARPNRSYLILSIESIDDLTHKLKLDAEPSVAGGSTWRILRTGLEQRSSISGGSSDALDPVKPGTMRLYESKSWSDYRLSVILRSTAEGTIGVIFRCQDKDNYYRFSMDRALRYRRLVRIIGGVHTVLASDDFIYRRNQDYLITIEVVGSSLRVYQDGSLTFDVIDNTFTNGSIGLYAWANGGARYSDVRVDDYRPTAPVPYRFKFITSQYANFFHHLHSYQDESWQGIFTATQLPEGELAKIAANAGQSGALPSFDEQQAYELFASRIREGVPQNPSVLQITRIVRNNAAIAWLVQSPEPIDWQRSSLTLARSPRILQPPTIPDVVKFTNVTFATSKPNEEKVGLLLRQPADLTGQRIEYRRPPGPIAEAGSDPILLFDRFDSTKSGALFVEGFGPNALDQYTLLDESPSSFKGEWSISQGHIVQIGNPIGGGSSEAKPDKPGALAIIGPPTWDNIRLRATLRSEETDDIGIVFRYQDVKNYYRFSMSRIGNYRRLVKKVNDQVTVLWEDDHLYEPGQSYRLMIDAYDDRLLGYLDDALLFSVQDKELLAGQVGLYCWRNRAAHFEALQVDSLDMNPLLWHPSFTELSDFQIIDTPGTSAGPSQWVVQNGELVQLSAIGSLEDFWQQIPGGANEIAMSESGSLWVIGVDGNVYHRVGDIWQGLGAPEALAARIAIDGEGVPWVIDNAQQVFQLNRDEGSWDPILLRANDIDIRTGTPPYVVSTTAMQGGFEVGWWEGAAGFQSLGIGAVRIAVAPNNHIWAIQDNGAIFLYDWIEWRPLADSARDIAIGADGTVWIIGTDSVGSDFALYRWNGSGWARMEGAAVAVAVDPAGNPVIVTSEQTIWWRDYAATGTHAVGGSSTWGDVQLSVRMRSDSDGALGVLVRYIDQDNYYRFSMARPGIHRLFKKVNGVLTLLWEEGSNFVTGRSYEVTVRADGSEISVYLDGVLLRAIRDDSLRQGAVGLFTRANAGAHFERLVVTDYRHFVGRWLVVDEGAEEAPSLWQLGRGALVQKSNIHSDGAPAFLGTYVVVGNPNWTEYQLTVRLRSDGGGAIGLIFRYIDRENYYRFSMDRQRGERQLIRRHNGQVTELWRRELPDPYPQGEPFTLTIEAMGLRLTGYLEENQLFDLEDQAHARGQVGLYCWSNTGARFERVEVRRPPLEALAVFRDRFAQGVVNDWKIDDDNLPPPIVLAISEYTTVADALDRNVSAPAVNLSGLDARFIAGDPSWQDIVVSVQVQLLNNQLRNDNEAGLIFRYIDHDNFYRVVINSEFQQARLEKKVHGISTVLWQSESSGSFGLGQTQDLTIVMQGTMLRGYLADVPFFVVEDVDLAAGQIGLYSATTTHVQFRRVRVFRVEDESADWLLDESFDREIIGRWSFVDEGTQSGPSQWLIQNGELLQTSEIFGGSTDPSDPDKPGTYALAGDSTWTDLQLTVRLRCNDGDSAIGVIFRYIDKDNYYLFLMDHQRSYRRLLKKTAGVVKVLKEDSVQYTLGRDYLLTWNCDGDQLTGYLDGIPLLAAEDGDHLQGKIGLFCWANQGAVFSEVRVAPPTWATYYIFGDEARLPAGSRIDVFAGNANDAPAKTPGVLQRFVAARGNPGSPKWSKESVELRWRGADGTIGHTRGFLSATYPAVQNWRLVRKTDGTAFFVVVPAGSGLNSLAPGHYRLELTYKRKMSNPRVLVLREAGNSDDEMVTIDIPWPTRN